MQSRCAAHPISSKTQQHLPGYQPWDETARAQLLNAQTTQNTLSKTGASNLGLKTSTCGLSPLLPRAGLCQLGIKPSHRSERVPALFQKKKGGRKRKRGSLGCIIDVGHVLVTKSSAIKVPLTILSSPCWRVPALCPALTQLPVAPHH